MSKKLSAVSSQLSAEDLAAVLLEQVRRYERNCRCPKCHSLQSGPLACIDCDWCMVNLRGLFSRELESQRVSFSSCSAEQDRVIVPSMKTSKAAHHKSSRSTKLKAKAKMKAKAKAKHGLKAKPRTIKMKVRKMKMRKPVRAVHLPPPRVTKPSADVTPIRDRMDSRVHTDAREYDRRVFVRFDAAGKDLVKAAAGETGLSPYIAHFATEAAKAKLQLVANPVSTKEAGVFARFANPSVKKMVAGVAASCGVSLSAYAAHFALEAAKAGKTMPVKDNYPLTSR